MSTDREEAGPVDFDRFFRAEYPRLLTSMYLACGDRTEAEDLAQAAMVAAFERWDTVAAASSSTAYLYRIAFNKHRSRLRRLSVAIRHRADPPAPRDPAEVASTRADTLRILGSLSRDEREALILVDWLGLSSGEAAAVLGIAPTSVRGRVHRARRTFRENFGEDDG